MSLALDGLPALTALRLPRLQRYVLTRAAVGVGGALAIISAVIMLVDFVALSRDVGVRAKETSAADLIALTLLQSPSVILVLTPFAFLFGVLAAFVGLNRRSELVAMRAAGVSAWGFILPAAFAAALFGVLTVLALNPIASDLNARFEVQKAQLMNGYLAEGEKAVWLRQGDGKHQIIVRAARRDPGEQVRLHDVSFFAYDLDKDGSLRFARRIDAAEARLETKRWRLLQVREAAPGGTALLSPSITLPSTLDSRTALQRFVSPQAVPFWSLPSTIARIERDGFSATAYRLQFNSLLAIPLLYAAMAILAAAFSLRLFRMGGLSQLVAAAVGLGFVFFFFNQLSSALGKAEVIPPMLAAWSPPLLTLLAGLTILAYTEDG
jgi:lipopolysaccharide export system permease protein